MQMKLSWTTSIVLFVHNLDTWEVETGESGVQDLFFCLHREFVNNLSYSRLYVKMAELKPN